MELEVGKDYINRNGHKVHITLRKDDPSGPFYGYYYGIVSMDNRVINYLHYQKDGSPVFGTPFEIITGEWPVKPSPFDYEPECLCDVKALVSYGHEKECAYIAYKTRKRA
jgi:hypothetical protein